MAKFQVGHHLAPGGRREGAGRKRADHKQIEQQAALVARQFIDKHVRPVLGTYLKLAKGYEETRYTAKGRAYTAWVPDGATTRHFIDKVIPDEKPDAGQNITIQFVKFDNPVSLPAQKLSGPVLEIDVSGSEAGGPGVASACGEGQDRLKFHDFQDVP